MTFSFKIKPHEFKKGEQVVEIYYTGFFPLARKELQNEFVGAIYTCESGIRVVSKYQKLLRIDADRLPISLDIYFELEKEDRL